MRRAIGLALFLTIAASKIFGSSLTVNAGTYGGNPPDITWWGSAFYLNDQGGPGIGVAMSGNLSLFQAGATFENTTWSVIGGSWQGSNTESLGWSTCYSSAVNAVTFDQFGQSYGGATCNPVPPAPPGGGNGGEILVDCDASSGCAEPLLINLDNGPFRLSGLNDPVLFDMNADGRREPIGWTARYSDVAFLALDRNGNRLIDNGSELFGNASPLPNGTRAANGFDALAQYDANGDGVIDSSDPIWRSLLLWTDRNHNGISERDELAPIASSEVSRIYLSYRWVGRRDSSGNVFGYQGRVVVHHDVRIFYDVFFATRH
jgi:hypothetical protein